MVPTLFVSRRWNSAYRLNQPGAHGYLQQISRLIIGSNRRCRYTRSPLSITREIGGGALNSERPRENNRYSALITVNQDNGLLKRRVSSFFFSSSSPPPPLLALSMISFFCRDRSCFTKNGLVANRGLSGRSIGQFAGLLTRIFRSASWMKTIEL